MDGDGTYLEDFISSLELLPNNSRRDFDLMRDLHKDSLELQQEQHKLEAAYLERARVRKAENKPVMVPVVEPLANIHLAHSQEHQAAEGVTTSITSITSATAAALSQKSPANSTTAAATTANKAATAAVDNVIGAAHDVSQDPEGAALLQAIAGVRARISSRLSQKTSIAINMTATLKQIQTKLNSDLAFFETSLRSCGDFEKASGAMPGTDVAIRPSQSSDEMILGKVIVYYADVGAYDVADVENSKRYHLSEALVTVLDMVDITNKRLSKGEVVYAVYPETTAFYLASVTQAPRRAPTGMEPTAMVQFQGDSDEHGVTPVRTVLLRHLFRAFV